jgi:spermidine/putrescine transport system ATP-binding protein
MDAIVSLAGVTKRFGPVAAVSDLDLAVGQGEFVTLLGPSGCGKTTTLRLISGFETADAGDIHIGGQRVNHVPPYRRNVNTVFQSYALFPHLSVFDNVGYGLTVKGADRAVVRRKVGEFLERVGLSDKARALPRQLSGGQMQRVALARALINEPKVLLLDEPLSALDAKLRHSMQIELKHMQRNVGISFVYVTHDQEEALVLSDRIAIMNRSRLVQLGTPEEVFERPRDLFVAGFVGDNNFLAGEVAGVDGDIALVAVAGGTAWRGRTMSPLAVGQAVTLAVRPQRLSVAIDGAAGAAANAIPARFAEMIYVGTLVRLVIGLPGGGLLQVEGPPASFPFDYRRLRAGDPVTIGCPADAVQIFDRQ